GFRQGLLGAARAAGAAAAGRAFLAAEQRDVAERVELLPRHALRVGHPVFVAARVAARRLAFLEERQVGVARLAFQRGELALLVHLDPEVAHAGFVATAGV